MLKEWRFQALSVVLLGSVYSLFFLNNIHIAHDSMVHYLWMNHLSEQLSTDYSYPRMLIDANHGFGSPVYYYYPPLAHSIALIFSLLLPISTALYLAVFLMSMVAVWGVFKLLQQNNLDKFSAQMGALFYVLSPYFIEIDFIYRFAFAELIALCIVPFLFLKYSKIFFIVPAVTALLLCHPPTALIVVPISFLWQFSINKNDFIKLGFLYFTAATLSAFYLLPALLHPNSSMKVMWEIYSYSRSYINKPIDFSSPTNFHTILRIYSWVAIFIFVLFFSLVDKSKTVFFVFISGVFSFFMMTSYSTFMYELIPLYQKIQFRFRWHSIFTLFLVFLFSVFLCKYKYLKKPIVFILLVIVVLPFFFYRYDVFVFNSDGEVDAALSRNKEVPEYSYEISDSDIQIFQDEFYVINGKSQIKRYTNNQGEVVLFGKLLEGDIVSIRRTKFQSIASSIYYENIDNENNFVSLKIAKETDKLIIKFLEPRLLFIANYISISFFFLMMLYMIIRYFKRNEQ